MDVAVLLPAPKSRPRNRSLKFRHRRRSGCEETSLVKKVPVRNLVMEEVRILKRGEIYRPDQRNPRSDSDLELIQDSKKEWVMELTDHAMRQVRVPDFMSANSWFAGSAVIRAPPPSSVPLPANFANKEVSMFNFDAVAAS